MGSLSESAARHLRRVRWRPNLPEWWPLVQIGLGVLLVLFLGFTFIDQVAGGDAHEAADGPGAITDPGALPQPVGDATTVPAAPATVAPVTDPGAPPSGPEVSAPAGPTAALFEEATVPVANMQGVPVEVPSAAVERAAAVLAASGYDNVGEPRVVLATVSRVVLSFTFDHDRDPQTPEVNTSVTVAKTGGGWVASVG